MGVLCDDESIILLAVVRMNPGGGCVGMGTQEREDAMLSYVEAVRKQEMVEEQLDAIMELKVTYFQCQNVSGCVCWWHRGICESPTPWNRQAPFAVIWDCVCWYFNV